jgi:hypothetical protein
MFPTPAQGRNRAIAALSRDLAIGALVGVFSGFFGVGGGIILVPILVIAMHLPQKQAQATSLVMVCLAALAGTATYAASNSIAWVPGVPLIAGGLIGTWIGSMLMLRTSDRRLQVSFALLLIFAAARLIWDHQPHGASTLPDLTTTILLGYALCGLAMGLLSALMGVGGGIIVIPLLVTIFGFSQQLANGTSLLVMVPIALLGALRLTRSGNTNWAQGSRFGLGAMPGAVLGASLALILPAMLLSNLFAVVLCAAAIQLLARARRSSPRGQAEEPLEGGAEPGNN